MNTNPKYSQDQINKVLSDADIRKFIPGCKTKAEQKLTCPFCGSKNFSVVHKSGKNFAHCFECEQNLNPVSAVMHFQGLKFIEALETCASDAGIPLIPNDRRRADAIKEAKTKNAKSFAAQQLESSGLTEADVVATTIDDRGKEGQIVPFQRGSIDGNFRASSYGDDMLIYYFDLDGRAMTYSLRGKGGRPQPYLRVRFSNPDAHPDRSGKPKKYQTMPGAPSKVYIPQYIRDLYKRGVHIETLFVQEGEKKAEKACKHGIPSIGIQGINNFGSERDGLLTEIQLLAKVCSITNIILVMDSDWNDLHRNITTGDDADKRPNSFSKAVIKFKAYIGSLHNAGLSVDVWWGHVNDNPGNDKGIDDLLCNTLKGQEEILVADIDKAMHAHDGRATYINIHKISAISDKKIEDFWLLNDNQAFFDFHKDRLKNVDTFKIRRIRYKVEDGKLVQLNRYSSDVDIWSIEKDSKDQDKVVFNMMESLEFLKANGFFRLRTVSNGLANYEYIRIDDGIIDRTTPVEVRGFIFDYIKGTCVKQPIVQEFFAKKLDTLLADKKLERMDYRENDFNHFSPSVQHMYYNNGTVEVTASDIVPEKPLCDVWRTRIMPRRFHRVPIISSIEKGDSQGYDGFHFAITPEGEKCEFLTYLINTSNTFYPHDAPRDLLPEEFQQFAQHLINKLTTIGYLLCNYKFSSERKAVIIQDYLMSEVGQRHGGAGKSILGEAIGKVIPQLMLDGKSETDDKFFFESVNLSTRNIFIDDVRVNYNFERIFAMVTGKMTILRKNMAPLEIEKEESPKILITTNHAINKAEEGATQRRIAYMEFSSWYNPAHTVIDDFHHMLFDDWDDEQWNLFDNLMAECLMYYLRSMELKWYREGMGAVPPPMGNIMLRTLRQEMSEVLFQWAEEYYDPSGPHLNATEKKAEILAAFFECAGKTGHGVTSSNFSRKIKAYCRFKGYDFNPNQPNEQGQFYADWKPTHQSESFIGTAHKSGGAEYYTIFSPDKQKEIQPF